MAIVLVRCWQNNYQLKLSWSQTYPENFTKRGYYGNKYKRM